MKKIARFVFPFLFVRNWHDGSWELSPIRMALFGGLFTLIVCGFAVVYLLQAPVIYVSE